MNGIGMYKPCVALALVLSVLQPGQTVMAQGDISQETVSNRSRQDLDPVGATVGAFRFFPSASIERLNNDNIFATNENTVEDDVYVLRPRLDLRSNWSRNSMRFGLESAINRFSDYSGEDHTDTRGFVNGRWDTARNGFFSAELVQSTNHEDRDSPDDVRGDSRTKFDEGSLSLNYRVAPGSLFGEIGVVNRTLDFQDTFHGDEILNNDDRDRDQLAATARIGYQLSDAYAIFLQHRQSSIDYDSMFDDNGFNRSSNGHETVVGATFNISEVLFGDVFVGSKSQAYDDARFAKIGGSSFGANLAWNVSPLTTINLEARREVEPTTVIGASGIDASTYSIGADHELLRNLILSAEWSSEDDAFKGNDRHDDYSFARLSARYLMNRRMEVRFSYLDYDRSSTDQSNFEFSRRLISVQIVGQL